MSCYKPTTTKLAATNGSLTLFFFATFKCRMNNDIITILYNYVFTYFDYWLYSVLGYGIDKNIASEVQLMRRKEKNANGNGKW